METKSASHLCRLVTVIKQWEHYAHGHPVPRYIQGSVTRAAKVGHGQRLGGDPAARTTRALGLEHCADFLDRERRLAPVGDRVTVRAEGY